MTQMSRIYHNIRLGHITLYTRSGIERICYLAVSYTREGVSNLIRFNWTYRDGTFFLLSVMSRFVLKRREKAKHNQLRRQMILCVCNVYLVITHTSRDCNLNYVA